MAVEFKGGGVIEYGPATVKLESSIKQRQAIYRARADMKTVTPLMIPRIEPALDVFCVTLCVCFLSGCMGARHDIDVSVVDEVDALTVDRSAEVQPDAEAPPPVKIEPPPAQLAPSPVQIERSPVEIEPSPGQLAPPPEVKRSAAFSTLQRGHRVEIKVYDEPELSGVFTIGPNGSISYPLLGKVPIVGLSPSDAGRLLHRMLGDGYLAHPLVSVHRVADTSAGYHILGAVRDPGTYETDTPDAAMTLQTLLAAAGGLDPQASRVGAMLIRQEPEGLVAYPVHPSALVPGRDAAHTIEMQPGDIITVPWRFEEKEGAK